MNIFSRKWAQFPTPLIVNGFDIVYYPVLSFLWVNHRRHFLKRRESQYRPQIGEHSDYQSGILLNWSIFKHNIQNCELQCLPVSRGVPGDWSLDLLNSLDRISPKISDLRCVFENSRDPFRIPVSSEDRYDDVTLLIWEITVNFGEFQRDYCPQFPRCS